MHSLKGCFHSEQYIEILFWSLDNVSLNWNSQHNRFRVFSVNQTENESFQKIISFNLVLKRSRKTVVQVSLNLSMNKSTQHYRHYNPAESECCDRHSSLFIRSNLWKLAQRTLSRGEMSQPPLAVNDPLERPLIWSWTFHCDCESLLILFAFLAYDYQMRMYSNVHLVNFLKRNKGKESEGRWFKFWRLELWFGLALWTRRGW